MTAVVIREIRVIGGAQVRMAWRIDPPINFSFWLPYSGTSQVQGRAEMCRAVADYFLPLRVAYTVSYQVESDLVRTEYASLFAAHTQALQAGWIYVRSNADPNQFEVWREYRLGITPKLIHQYRTGGAWLATGHWTDLLLGD
jgi:hypothetical protein